MLPDKIKVMVQNGPYSNTVEVMGHQWESYRYDHDMMSGKISPSIVGTYVQIPLMLAWAVTIHKSQGSEFAHTIVVLPKGKSKILTRELLYTGITRAKQGLVLLAPQPGVLADAVRRQVQRAGGLQQV
jgi:ATP-dependent exoDNAse (exonuclease V) alpha subunit